MAAAIVLGAAPVRAQTRADSAAVLVEAARRLAAEGSGEVADALYRWVVERFGDTPAAELAAQRLRQGGRGAGRVELQVWGTLYGLGLGIAVPLAADADGPEPYGIGLLVGGPAGFLASRAYARSRPLSEGQARAITLGGTWGAWQGLGWALVADVGVDRREFCSPELPPGEGCYTIEEGDGTDETVTAMIAGSLAGIATGAILARKPIPRGTATAVNFGALWGSWFGVAVGVLADADADDALLRAALLGGDAGLLATALLAPGWNMTRERARLISIAGVLGGLAGAGIDLLTQPSDEKVAIAIPLAGSVAGLVLGALTTRDRRGGDAAPGPDGAAAASALPMPGLLPVRDAAGRRRLVPGLTYALRF